MNKQKQNSVQYLVQAYLIICILFSASYLKAQVIVYPDDGTDIELFAAKEVRRYIYVRTDLKLPVQGETNLPSSGDLILVANDNNPMVQKLRDQIDHTTSPGGIIIKSIESEGRNILVITGNNSESTLIAAYRFAEHLGVGFDLAGDAIPDAKISLTLTGFNEVGERRFEIAGVLPFHDFFQGPDLWSTYEYMIAINQLAKMGMNFIGLHNYVTHSTYEEKGQDIRQGPEPNVWIGLQEDINPDGTVNWAYPAFYRHSHSPNEIWGTVEWNTGNYFGGSADIFPRDFWGSDIFGTTAMPTDIASSVQVFNNQGRMFNKTFGFANKLGVKTAIGSELPLGLEAEGPEVEQNWVRGMPLELQDRLNDPGSDATVKAVYKGIFDRIMKTHHLDYFWLWSYEIWSAYGVNNVQKKYMKDDIGHAMEAASELNVPFTLGHAGWILGSVDDPAEFDDVMPKENPFYGLWDQADGMEELSFGRVKWAATWLEEDWGLIQPQLEAHRIYEDVKAAIEKGCTGLIGKGWRTRAMSMNIHAMKMAFWAYGPTGSAVNMDFPVDRNEWIDEVYMDWATRWFGPEVADGVNNIMGTMDKGGEPAVPGITEWDTHEDGKNSAGGAIIGDVYNPGNTAFVSEFEALESNVVGIGNQERFKYWLKTWQSYRAKDEFGGYKENANRSAMATKFHEFITLDIERMVDACDVGEIMHNNVLNWHQLVQLNNVDGSENPSKTYTGEAFVRVMPVRTQVAANEELKLNIVALGVGTPMLKYRELGGGDWMSLETINEGRSVYSATIPAQTSDFEYYLESGSTVFPVTATAESPIYQTVVVMGSETNIERFSLSTSALNGSISPDGGYFDANSIITLTAIPDDDYEFTHWSGDLSGSENPTTIIMDNNKTVVANYALPTFLQVEDRQIAVFPNPSDTGSFTITLQGLTGTIALRVTDMNGKTVFKKRIKIQDTDHVKLPLHNLGKGNYIFTITDREEVIYKKIILN